MKNVGGSHTCQLCFRENCAQCVNFFGLCDTCVEGYSVSYPTYKCAKSTVENCAFMYNDMCSECHEGYVLGNDGECIKQGNSCYSYKCTKCQEN